jgi:hypothetical protein
MDDQAFALRLAVIVGNMGLTGLPVLGVPYAGTSVHVLITVDDKESERRAQHGLGTLCDELALEALVSLPLEAPVPVESVDPIRRIVIDGCPRGVVDVADGCYVRRWRPACKIEATFAFATLGGWLSPLERLSTTVGLADRYLVMPGAPRRSTVDRAGRVGVGIVQSNLTGGTRLLLPPAPRPPRLGVRRWRFLEAAYGRWLAVTAAMPIPLGQAAARRSLPSSSPASPRR